MPLDAHRVAKNLWVGAAPPPGDYSKELDVIVLVADDYQPDDKHFPRVKVRRHPFDDTMKPNEHDLRQAAVAAAAISKDLRAGRRVLVTCRMGRNRSGFVAALALRALGMPARAALETVRSKRKDALGIHAIENKKFQSLLLGS